MKRKNPIGLHQLVLETAVHQERSLLLTLMTFNEEQGATECYQVITLEYESALQCSKQVEHEGGEQLQNNK